MNTRQICVLTISILFFVVEHSAFAETINALNPATVAVLITTTTASDATINYRASAQTVTLRASVSVIGGTVSEGTVSFQLKRFGNLVGVATTSATVSNGNVSVKYALLAGQALGDYTILASFSGSETLSPSVDSTKKLTIRGEEPEIVSSLTASGSVGLPFSYTIQATGTTPITFTAQPLPAGLSLHGSVISGTPTVAGKTNVYVKATNVVDHETEVLVITINPAGAPQITSALQVNGTFGVPFTYVITASGSAPITFGATGLPSGLSFDVPSATISGTPNATGSFPITLTAANSGGTDTDILNLTLLPSGAPEITSPMFENTKVGLTFSYTITASGDGPIEFGASNLPAWLTFAEGVLSGIPTPADVGVSQATITASNANGTDTQEVSITVAPNVTDPPVITNITPSRNPVRTNTDVSFTVEAVAPSGQPLTYSWFFFIDGIQDGPPLPGATVSRSFAQGGAYTVVAIAFDGFSKSANFMKLAVALDPNSGASSKNVAIGQSAFNPNANFGIGVPDSVGGVVDVDLQNGNAPAPGMGFTTRLPGVMGTFDSAALADKFSSADIYVIESVLTEPGAKDRKARMMVPIGLNETGAGSIADDRALTGLHSYISRGRFGFGSVLDTFALTGSFELPSGMQIGEGMALSIGMSNVTAAGFMTSRGRVMGLKAPFRKLQFNLPRIDRTTGRTMKTATVKFYMLMKGADLSGMGFDTDGIARMASKSTAPRQMQFAMVLGGVPYYFQTQVQYSYDPNNDFGQVQGRQ